MGVSLKVSVTFAALLAVVPAHGVSAEHRVPFFLSAAEEGVRQGFVRVINRSDASGEVSITAVDDSGAVKVPVALSIGANAALHFNSSDLEAGNADKGLSGGIGPGQGAWRLYMESNLNVQVLSYVRTRDGFVTSMYEALPSSANGLRHRAVIFNPASNFNQVSFLRLINETDEDAQVSIAGLDARGIPGDAAVRLSVPANAARMLSAQDLESGAGVGVADGALGDGAGKWRLLVESSRPLTAMSLLESPEGHISNLSTIPAAHDGRHIVPLFPPSADPKGRQGFVRVVNNSDEVATVSISASNNLSREYDSLSLSVGPNETRQFNADDLELGNEGKGLAGSTGMGGGDWVLEMSSGQDVDVMAYVRTPGGFLTSAHDLVAGGEEGTHHQVAFFNPGSNDAQVSVLRMINLGEEAADIVVSGRDDAGNSPGSEVMFSVPAGQARSLKSSELELGEREFAAAEFGFEDEPFVGALGDGVVKWRLTVQSSVPVLVMSILETPTGHLTNLSTAP